MATNLIRKLFPDYGSEATHPSQRQDQSPVSLTNNLPSLRFVSPQSGNGPTASDYIPRNVSSNINMGTDSNGNDLLSPIASPAKSVTEAYTNPPRIRPKSAAHDKV